MSKSNPMPGTAGFINSFPDHLRAQIGELLKAESIDTYQLTDAELKAIEGGLNDVAAGHLHSSEGVYHLSEQERLAVQSAIENIKMGRLYSTDEGNAFVKRWLKQ